MFETSCVSGFSVVCRAQIFQIVKKVDAKLYHILLCISDRMNTIVFYIF